MASRIIFPIPPKDVCPPFLGPKDEQPASLTVFALPQT
jgi:hypothetical protein